MIFMFFYFELLSILLCQKYLIQQYIPNFQLSSYNDNFKISSTIYRNLSKALIGKFLDNFGAYNPIRGGCQIWPPFWEENIQK